MPSAVDPVKAASRPIDFSLGHIFIKRISSGGATTRIRALVDAEGHPIRLTLTEGQAHDGRSVADMLETLEAGHILLVGCACDSVHMAANL